MGVDVKQNGNNVALQRIGRLLTWLGGKCLSAGGRGLLGILALSLLLTGCNNLDNLIQGKDRSRNHDYEASQPSVPVTREEPYAVLAGYTKDGERLYLIYWAANIELNLTGMKETDVDALGLPKYKN